MKLVKDLPGQSLMFFGQIFLVIKSGLCKATLLFVDAYPPYLVSEVMWRPI